MEAEIAGALAQFGVAGLIAWMWLSERRAAAARERQLTEAHERVLRDRRETEVLIGALGDNTRALASLEATQRGLVAVLGSGRGVGGGGGMDGGAGR
jgi:hypothetical protein